MYPISLDWERLVRRVLIFVVFMVPGGPLLAEDEFVFTDDFESDNRTVVSGAVVQLRDAGGTVKAERTANDAGAFEQFPGALIEAGDEIVMFCFGIYTLRPPPAGSADAIKTELLRKQLMSAQTSSAESGILRYAFV